MKQYLFLIITVFLASCEVYAPTDGPNNNLPGSNEVNKNQTTMQEENTEQNQ